MIDLRVSEVMVLIVVSLSQFGLLWYKMGTLERAFKDHCQQTHSEKEE